MELGVWGMVASFPRIMSSHYFMVVMIININNLFIEKPR